jgi:hypothetical protein
VWGVNKDIKVQVNKQKAQQCLSCPADVDYDKMPIDTTSSQPCSKPNPSGSLFFLASNTVLNFCIQLNFKLLANYFPLYF